MRDQPINRVVNALRTQQRLILHLACGHNISLSRDQYEMCGGETGFYQNLLDRKNTWLCPICPDLPTSKTVETDDAFRRASFGRESE